MLKQKYKYIDVVDEDSDDEVRSIPSGEDMPFVRTSATRTIYTTFLEHIQNIHTILKQGPSLYITFCIPPLSFINEGLE